MQVAHPNVSFFVKVDCQAHSRHRDPQGVYHVKVVKEETILHCANAAIQIVKDHVAFIDENIDKVTIRVFSPDGDEVPVAASVDSQFCEYGSFQGRAEDYPENITVQ